MNASELIALLKQLPPDTKILVRGYEDGYNDIIELKPVRVQHNPDADWYYGEYAVSYEPEAIEVIELYGENRNEVK
jgi:hypothetical protein